MPKCDFNKLQSSFIEIAFPHGCSPVNLLPIFRTPFLKNSSGWLLLELKTMKKQKTQRRQKYKNTRISRKCRLI